MSCQPGPALAVEPEPCQECGNNVQKHGGHKWNCSKNPDYCKECGNNLNARHHGGHKRTCPRYVHIPTPPEGARARTQQGNVDTAAQIEAQRNAQVIIGQLRAELAPKTGDPLKRALRALQLTWHPDKNPGTEGVASIVFQFVQSEWNKFQRR